MSITVMKQALEALEAPSPMGQYKAITSLRQAIAEAEKQEPMKLPLPCDVKVGHVTIRKGVALSVLVSRMQVLYNMAQASPPQRQPLTDEQIEEIAARTLFPVNFARAIEAAHGITGEK